MQSTPQISLSQLNRIISDTIKNKFSGLKFWVIADITSHSFNVNSRTHYFELVEKDQNSSNLIAKLKGTAFGHGAMQLSDFEKNTGQKFTNNINVLVQVSVDYHLVYGISLNVLDVDINFTLGLLQKQREQTLLELVYRNDFISQVGAAYKTKNNQLKLKPVLQNIALIASETSAGREDFRHSLLNNQYGFKFKIDDYFALVQGDHNEKQFLAKIIEIYNSGIPYDAVVITRGGGAQTDFLLFDNYNIARAVAKFPIPIITGIGHQKNITIVDLMAHSETKTPTKAAELIIAHNNLFEKELLLIQKNIVIKTQQLFSNRLQRLSNTKEKISNGTRIRLTLNKDSIVKANQIIINSAKSLLYINKTSLNNTSTKIIAKPQIIIYNRHNDLKNRFNNIKTFKSQYLKNQSAYLGNYKSIIRMMSPENILKKGYAIVKINNKITSNPKTIKLGSSIEIIVADKIITSTVTKKTDYDGKEFNL